MTEPKSPPINRQSVIPKLMMVGFSKDHATQVVDALDTATLEVAGVLDKHRDALPASLRPQFTLLMGRSIQELGKIEINSILEIAKKVGATVVGGSRGGKG